MNVASERIWAFHDGPMVGYFVGLEERGTNVAEYIRADIAAAPDLHRIVTEQAAEIERLREALGLIANHRYCCHAHDDDMGHPLRAFDEEDVKIMEYAAKAALKVKP